MYGWRYADEKVELSDIEYYMKRRRDQGCNNITGAGNISSKMTG